MIKIFEDEKDMEKHGYHVSSDAIYGYPFSDLKYMDGNSYEAYVIIEDHLYPTER